MSRRRSMLNEEMFGILSSLAAPYDFVIHIKDNATFAPGGKDNTIAVLGPGSVNIPASDGIFAQMPGTTHEDFLPVEGFGTTTTDAGGVFKVELDGSFTFETRGSYDNINFSRSHTEVLPYVLENYASGKVLEGSITVKIYGTNKAPKLIAPFTDEYVFSLDYIDWNIRDNFIDPNNDETSGIEIESLEQLPSGLSFDGTRLHGQIARLEHTNTNSVNPGEWVVSFKATDTWGASTTEGFNLTISRATLEPLAKTVETDFRDPISIAVQDGLLENMGSNGNVDNIGLRLVHIDGHPITSDGTLVDLGPKGTVLANLDGSFTYDPNGQFHNNQVEQTISITFGVENDAGAAGGNVLSVDIMIRIEYPTFPVEPEMESFEFEVLDGDPTVIGSTVTYQVISKFNKGVIDLEGVTQPRTGDVESFTYTGPGLGSTRPASNNANAFAATQIVSPFVVTADESVRTFTVRANYQQGVQPLDSGGFVFDQPYPSSSSNALTYVMEPAYKYAWWSTYGTSNLLRTMPVIHVGLFKEDDDGLFIDGEVIGHSPNYVLTSRLDDTQQRVIKVPQKWGGLKGIKTLDYTNKCWVWLYGYEDAFLMYFTHTVETINGVDYDVYTMNSGAYSSPTPVRLYFDA